ncbi:uncharacterized protein LOC106880515 [Octopus bimaculoides]|uniref:Mediator of RNA polymerase II transcription subunit 7 n=1 Tax=Octopus bimaculoides TaxID=37653 RepID=A0A0L8I8Q3_OCTBM|nr:uncharacterized protein LOC106880515 [Octopus bimaculoides]|eukprot:XP_014785981.1 PREDICTED: uncharacterized protein LOC106880515 [Octopus bimaculoides]
MSKHLGVSSFPLPPMQYVRYCTDENMAKGIPAPPPTQEDYTVFGVPSNINDPIQTLESQGLTQLYPENCNRKKEMKKLNHSILVCFLDLIDILIQNPSSSDRNEKLNDLRLLFINLNHLINEIRPNQAREALRMMMMKQKCQTVELLNDLEKKLAEAKELIAKSIQNLQVSNPDDCEAFKLSGLLESGSCRLNENIEMTSECSVQDYTINTIEYLNEVCNFGREDSVIQSEVKMENIDCKSKVLAAQESNRDLGATGGKACFDSKLSVRNTADVKIENEDILTNTCANKNQKDMEFTDSMKVTADYIGLSNSLLAAKNGVQLALCEVKAMSEDLDLSECKQGVINNTNKTCIDVIENEECNVKLERKSKDSCSEDIGSSQSESVDVCFSQSKQDEDAQSKQEAERDSTHETGDDLPLLQGAENEVSLIHVKQGWERDASLERQAKDDASLVQSVGGDVSLMKSEQGGESNLQSKQGDVLFRQNKKEAEGDSRLVSPNRNLEDDTQFLLYKQGSEREMLLQETSDNLVAMESRKLLARDTNIEESKEEIYDKNIGENKEIYDDKNIGENKEIYDKNIGENKEIYDDKNIGENKETYDKNIGENKEIYDDKNIGENKEEIYDINIRESKEEIYEDTNVRKSKGEITDDTNMGESKGRDFGTNAKESKEDIHDDTNIWETKEVTNIDEGVVESKEEMPCGKILMTNQEETTGDMSATKNQEETANDSNVVESQEETACVTNEVESQEEADCDANEVENQETAYNINAESQKEMDSSVRGLESQDERGDGRGITESKKEWEGNINVAGSQEEMAGNARIMESQVPSKSNKTTDDDPDNVSTLQGKRKHDDDVGHEEMKKKLEDNFSN